VDRVLLLSIYALMSESEAPFPSSTSFDGRGVGGAWARGTSRAYLVFLRRVEPHLRRRNGTGTSRKDAAPSTVDAMRGFNVVYI